MERQRPEPAQRIEVGALLHNPCGRTRILKARLLCHEPFRASGCLTFNYAHLYDHFYEDHGPARR